MAEVPGFYYDASKNRYFPKKDERNATKHKTITLPAVLTAAPTPSISQLLDARQLGSIRPDSQSLLSFELEHLIARRITLPPLGANVVSIFQFQKVSVLVIYELAAVEIFLTDVESNRLDVVKHNFDNPIKRFSKKIVASFKRSPSCLRLILEDLSRDVISCSFEDWVVTVTKSLSLEASSFLQFAHQNASQGIPARSCFLEGRNGVFYNHQGDSFNLLAMSKKKLPFTNVTFVVRSPKSESMLLGCRDGSVYRHDKDQGFKLVGSVDGPVAFIEELSCCLIVATCKDTVYAFGSSNGQVEKFHRPSCCAELFPCVPNVSSSIDHRFIAIGCRHQASSYFYSVLDPAKILNVITEAIPMRYQFIQNVHDQSLLLAFPKTKV